jgi:hypothetical protein
MFSDSYAYDNDGNVTQKTIDGTAQHTFGICKPPHRARLWRGNDDLCVGLRGQPSTSDRHVDDLDLPKQILLNRVLDGERCQIFDDDRVCF